MVAKWTAASRRLLCLGMIWLSIPACTFFQEAIGWKFDRPSVKLRDLKVKSVNLQQLDLELSIDVQNPNPFELRFSELTYELVYNQGQLAKGFYQPDIKIPARDAVLVKIPLEINMTESYSLLQAYFARPKKTLEVVWKATANFGTKLGAVKVEFDARKNLR